MENNDFGVDISSANIKYVGCRGNRLAISITSPIEVGATFVPRYRTHLFLSGHALTHIDLPWPLSETMEKIIQLDSNIKPFPAPDDFVKLASSTYLSPRRFDAVILDLTDKYDEIDKFIDFEFLKTDIPKFNFESLMRKLEITWDDLGELGTEGRLREKFLILKTGWEHLAERSVDLNNTYFEFRHPYLVHPYLTEATLRRILYAGVEGIGTDTYCLENPVYFTSGQNLPEYASQYYEIFEKKKFLPILVTLLTEFKVYVKNLRNLDHERLRTKPGQYLTGKLRIIPIDFGDRDMCLVKAFFEPKT